MKSILALLLIAALAGCTADSEPESAPLETTTMDPEPTDPATNETGEPEDPAPEQDEAENSTQPDPEPETNETTEAPAGNETQEENVTEAAPQPVLMLTERFEGSAPDPAQGEAALSRTHPFNMPPGATRLEVTYNATYTGAWSAVAWVDDSAGTERAQSNDICGSAPPGALSAYSCTMEFEEDLISGEWGARYSWQLGEVTETYTIDVKVWGFP